MLKTQLNCVGYVAPSDLKAFAKILWNHEFIYYLFTFLNDRSTFEIVWSDVYKYLYIKYFRFELKCFQIKSCTKFIFWFILQLELQKSTQYCQIFISTFSNNAQFLKDRILLRQFARPIITNNISRTPVSKQTPKTGQKVRFQDLCILEE